jgi:hypothetical protein
MSDIVAVRYCRNKSNASNLLRTEDISSRKKYEGGAAPRVDKTSRRNINLHVNGEKVSRLKVFYSPSVLCYDKSGVSVCVYMLSRVRRYA